jgi:transposase-like protein
MARPAPPWVASEPLQEFAALTEKGLDLEDVKRQYVRAMYYRTRSVLQTADALKVDRATVYRFLERRAV